MSTPDRLLSTAADEQRIVVLDFGSQYTQLIARRVRESHVYSEILPYDVDASRVLSDGLKGIILSGGPGNISSEESLLPDERILDAPVPILGICYGMQILGQHFGGKVSRASRREYGSARLSIIEHDHLFKGMREDVQDETTVWMSHGDRIESLGPELISIAKTANSPNAAIRHTRRPIFGVQFHPEVSHTTEGRKILENFVIGICNCEPSWTPGSFIEREIARCRELVGGGKVVCATSGGVDSTVVAVLLSRAIGDNLIAIFVDNGLLRKGEASQVVSMLRKELGINVTVVSASERFLSSLRGVSDPQEKRKIIGNLFIEVFEETAGSLKDCEYLAQGTLYPDVIESVPVRGPSALIKGHHNVWGLPDRMKLKLIEPLRELFKDEVRIIGKRLGIPDRVLMRQPFPGPGLAVRIIGPIAQPQLKVLREADAIVREEIEGAGLSNELWQWFAVLLPVKSVGVMGDERTYENAVAIRVVKSLDAMTADWARLPYDVLGTISSRIINEVDGVNRVVYDISTKPPSTIEWE
ncbi:MAG: GMP synthase (glutamine-hydrolyzing) [Candidatus Coatesbacteria bacterium]|nr:MAG: GMP synthase (glutamine-hydrolyzing) [Candidatus Coatesbacteria bacterium]